MIEIVLAHSDLARVRFAHWLSATRSRPDRLRLELLLTLVPTGRYLPVLLFHHDGASRGPRSGSGGAESRRLDTKPCFRFHQSIGFHQPPQRWRSASTHACDRT